MAELPDLHNYLITNLESSRKLQNELEAVRKEIETRKKRSIFGEGAFVAPVPLRSGRGFGDARFWSSEGHSEGSCSESGIEACW